MNNEKAEAETTVTLSKETNETTEAQPAVKESKLDKRLRAFPLWLRVLTFLIALASITVAGLMVGYSIIGGGDASDVLNMDTWTHIVDIMNGKE